MSVQAMSWVLDHSKTHLAARLVLLSIANHAAPDGTDAWPSIANLASAANISESSARRCVKELEAGGHILVDRGGGRYASGDQRRRRGEGSARHSTYAVVMDHEQIEKLREVREASNSANLNPFKSEPVQDEPAHVEHGTVSNSPLNGSKFDALFLIEPSLEPSVEPSTGDSFEAFWESYPKRNGSRSGKKLARQFWAKMPVPDRQAVMADMPRYQAEAAAMEPPGRYVVDAIRYLRDRRWEDDHGTSPTPTSTGPPGRGPQIKHYTDDDWAAERALPPAWEESR